jgi:hypothetical protein
MKETITVQIGGFGNRYFVTFDKLNRNRLGHQFFSDLHEECDTLKNNTYFEFGEKSQFARSVLVDLDPTVIDSITSDPLRLYHPDNIICASVCPGRNWASW